jgi:hypothetical protein
MKTMKFAAAAVAAAGALIWSGQASAAIMLARYEGVITGGYDTANVFGLGGSMGGASYVATFTYDTARFTAHDLIDEPDFWYEAIFGEYADAPVQSVSIEINGHTDTVAFGPDANYVQAQQYAYHDENGDRLGGFLQGDDSSKSFLAHVVLSATTVAPRTLAEPWSGAGPDAHPAEGYFRRLTFRPDGGLSSIYEVRGKPTKLTVTAAAAVPEPAAWALMILGFGAAGAMLRVARRTRALA